MAEPLIAALSRRQLAAYNAQDIDAFCACFHRDVCVLDAEGNRTLQGHEAFRSRYHAMFTAHADVFAEVTQRVVLGAHIVEFERWSRVERATGIRHHGEVIVRYTERDGLIRWVEFLRP
jgi:uncharacterized protein (TIGR02246 family)